jgi:hypothetical protein
VASSPAADAKSAAQAGEQCSGALRNQSDGGQGGCVQAMDGRHESAKIVVVVVVIQPCELARPDRKDKFVRRHSSAVSTRLADDDGRLLQSRPTRREQEKDRRRLVIFCAIA